MKPNFAIPEVITKGWGTETIFANNNEYCGKLLTIHAGHKFSMHAHLEKLETFWILKGDCVLRWIDTQTAEVHEQTQLAGSVVDIPRLMPHQIEAISDCEIVEFSTTHRDTDSYRYMKGDSQK